MTSVIGRYLFRAGATAIFSRFEVRNSGNEKAVAARDWRSQFVPAEAAIDLLADKYRDKYDKAVACLTKDREAVLAFFDFPAEHWDHLRTSNPIESVFATVRHRTVRTKGALSAKTAKVMIFKLVNAAAKTWRPLNGENQLPKVVRGFKFKNGIEVTEMPAHHAA